MAPGFFAVHRAGVVLALLAVVISGRDDAPDDSPADAVKQRLVVHAAHKRR